MALITKEEKKEVIDHYNRMIAWAEKQDSKEFPKSWEMEIAIGENWTSRYCPLCKKYTVTKEYGVILLDTKRMCRKCPLFSEGFSCNAEGSYWRKIARSFTWKEWVINAKKFCDVLSQLLEASE